MSDTSSYAEREKRVREQRFSDLALALDVQHHDVPERHIFGEAFGLPPMPLPSGGTPSVGSSDTPARADHVHALTLVETPWTPTVSQVAAITYTIGHLFHVILGPMSFVSFRLNLTSNGVANNRITVSMPPDGIAKEQDDHPLGIAWFYTGAQLIGGHMGTDALNNFTVWQGGVSPIAHIGGAGSAFAAAATAGMAISGNGWYERVV